MSRVHTCLHFMYVYTPWPCSRPPRSTRHERHAQEWGPLSSGGRLVWEFASCWRRGQGRAGRVTSTPTIRTDRPVSPRVPACGWARGFDVRSGMCFLVACLAVAPAIFSICGRAGASAQVGNRIWKPRGETAWLGRVVMVRSWRVSMALLLTLEMADLHPDPPENGADGA